MPDISDSPLLVDFIYTPVVNFSFQQNHVPIVRALTITNQSDKDYEPLTIEIRSDSNITEDWNQTLSFLSKGETRELGSFQLVMDAKYLAELTEKITGYLTLTIYSGTKPLYKNVFPITVLAYDQWNGISSLPELLAAFITPNHPEIAKIIRRASFFLEKWTGNPSFDAYQSKNPNRVRKQMGAIYESISEMQLTYCIAPASFEEQGQRVRLVDAIINFKLANCLDLSLLYAACLEAVGIHPLVIIMKGHAFAGGWLIEQSFSDIINDDPSLLTKRIAEGISEITLVEATCMNAGNPTGFDTAVIHANEKIRHADDFVLFIDVRRARFSTSPLPLRIQTSTGWVIEDNKAAIRGEFLPSEVDTSDDLTYADKIKVSRQLLWERKLLDLTLRNNLLNIRVTKSIIQFITINPASLEDAFANGEEFQVLKKPVDWENPQRDSGIYRSVHSSDPILDLVKQELAEKRIRSYLTESELNTNLTHLFRLSRLSLEENGANTLYVGLGLLKWYETPASEKARYAPILLLPVEIIRRSAQKGYIIRAREEETILNITLLEMIRHDFGISIGGLETLPKDESGIDVKRIFTIIRQAVMSKSRWDVEEQSLLGIFSFSKFILWKDIHSYADQLSKNKVVASLISGKLEWAAHEGSSFEENLDHQFAPGSLNLPISYDSSQLEAILQANHDKSFVLHGPPGTGKSQTITNIIASSLYAGKKVLFVAAKKAALDVVEDRLKAIGIGAFCLELHSNKSKKSSVLQQLKETMQVVSKSIPENFTTESIRLQRIRAELNEYVSALHEKYSFGYSLADLFNLYSKARKESDHVFFSAEVLSALPAQKLTEWNDLVAEMQTIGIQIGNPAGHAFKLVHIKQYSNSIKERVNVIIRKLIAESAAISELLTQIKSVLKVENKENSRLQAQSVMQVVNLMLQLPDVPASIFEVESIDRILAELTGIAEHGIKRDHLRKILIDEFEKEILGFPASATIREWNISSEKWFLARWLKQQSIAKKLRRLSILKKIDKDKIPETLENINQYQQEAKVIRDVVYLPTLLGFLWNDGACNWEELKVISDLLIQINRHAAFIENTSSTLAWRQRLARDFGEGSKSYLSFHKVTLIKFKESYNSLSQVVLAADQLLSINLNDSTLVSSDWFVHLFATANRWLENIEGLKDWYNWLIIKERLSVSGLQTLISAYEEGLIQSQEITTQFKKGFYRSAAEYIIEKNPVLNNFNGRLFEEKIQKFRVISQQYESLTKQELFSKLASRLPSFTLEASQSSETGFLQRNIRNNGRAVSIRKIFDEIPSLLPRMAPCMLMSPISVAQYFDASSKKFDLVIFDEASQLPTCEAVSAIARAEHVIVVGDPKQLPPTSFFTTNNTDDDNIEKEDLESILDDCLALSMPSKHLLWHYRSKHESLIAFSNAKYYENKLFTFPSMDDIATKVEFVPVQGFYDKGKTRQNEAEANAILDDVVRRLSDPLMAGRSIGIVTFSSAQQTLIDDKLTDLFTFRPDLERLAFESKEPIFIKNLENVQGDERDVILFSIGYGPDAEGKISLNFGPINREGGWRRLNVAVSRARYEMKVFSTLRSDQIDISRTSSEGVAGLKSFLAYAEKGRGALPGRTRQMQATEPSFENTIASEIKKLGYDVHTHIGCSGYKIDVGIVNPENKDQYILGLICDGKNYFSSKTARDREIVQIDVLKSLGWEIHRVWSTEYWEKPEKVIAGISEAIHLAKENPAKAPDQSTLQTVEISSAEIQESLESGQTLPSTVAKPYRVCFLKLAPLKDIEEFFWATMEYKIREQAEQILETESPISRDLLCKRILTACGITRLGNRIDAHFERIFKKMQILETRQDNNIIFWKGNTPETYKAYRIAQKESDKRDADDLPANEVANAVFEILRNQISLPYDSLIRETARILGYSRIGANVETAISIGIQKAIENRYAIKENGRVKLNET